jgi:hypothetical protein
MKPPVFIWGSPQSGTFLVYDIIASCGGFVFHHVKGWRKKGLAARPLRELALPNGSPQEGMLRFWSGCGLPFEKKNGRVVDRVLGVDDIKSIDLHRVRRKYRALQWPWQKARILDKCPNYTFMVPVLDAAFPSALHVFCTRDKHAIANSMVRRVNGMPSEGSVRQPSGWYAGIRFPGYERFNDSSLEERHIWLAERILEVGHAAAKTLEGRCIISSHETMLAQPRASIQRLADFIGSPLPRHLDQIIAEGIDSLLNKWNRAA